MDLVDYPVWVKLTTFTGEVDSFPKTWCTYSLHPKHYAYILKRIIFTNTRNAILKIHSFFAL